MVVLGAALISYQNARGLYLSIFGNSEFSCKIRGCSGTFALVLSKSISCALILRTILCSRMPELLSCMPARIIEPWREHFTTFIRVGKVFLGHFAYNT